MGSTEKRIEQFEVSNGEAMGYDDEGRRIVRVPMTEAQITRPRFDDGENTYRLDVT